MIPLSGLIGKICLYIAQKITDDKLKKSSDKKGYACELFTRVYFLIVELDSLTELVSERNKNAIEKEMPELLGYAIRDLEDRLSRSSNEFIETFTLLGEVLEIYDPELRRAISSIVAWKFNFLWEASKSAIVLEGDKPGGRFVKLTYLDPNDAILEMDIDKMIEWDKEHPEEINLETCEWPQRLFFGMDLTSAFDSKEISFKEIDDLKHFQEMLDKHGAVLKNAKDQMKKFLRENFTIEEVLYHKKSIDTFLT